MVKLDKNIPLINLRSLLKLVLVFLVVLHHSEGQRNVFRGFVQGINHNFRRIINPVRSMFRSFSPTVVKNEDGGTKVPLATGKDVLFPADCGRDPKKGTGLLCFPDGLLCQKRVNRVGNDHFNGHTYWFSWKSNDPTLSSTKWDWFNARNYCRKRCMDLVSIETEAEYQFLKRHLGTEKFFWTSGRLCDFDGCDQPHFFPKNINGWFWSANQVRLAPSNSRSQFHDWSPTGGFQPPRPQPDNREQLQQRGASESCLAVMNNFYGDGIKWHDVACHHDKPIICEDVEGHLSYARRTFPHIRIP